jgi:hypothetical protein
MAYLKKVGNAATDPGYGKHHSCVEICGGNLGSIR